MNSNQSSAVINIPGINTETALSLYDFNIEIYIAVLRSYIDNALEVIDYLQNVSEETLDEYAVNVHGLKGISGNIGADELQKAAFDLEQKARSKNLAEVLSGNDSLLKETKNLITNIQAWLNQYDKTLIKQKLPKPDSALLIRLRKSCESYDIKGIDEVMDALESKEYEKDGALITWLRGKINASDFSAVANRLSEYGEKP